MTIKYFQYRYINYLRFSHEDSILAQVLCHCKNSDPAIPTLEISQAIPGNADSDIESLDFSNTQLPNQAIPRSPSDWDTIQELKKTIKQQSIALNKSSRSSRFLVAVSFATGVALSGGAASLYGQSAPNSPLQAAMSFLAKKFSSDKTGYEIVSEARAHDRTLQDQKVLVQQQETEIQRLKQMIALYEEMTTIQKNLIAGFQEKADAPAVVRKVTATQPVVAAPLVMSTQLASEPVLIPNLDAVFDRVSTLRQSILAEFQEPNLDIRVRKTAQNHVHVYLTYYGKDSLGFYAEMPQFANRMEAAGMKEWIRESIAQLRTVNMIESVAQSRNIGKIPQQASVMFQTRRLYSGGVEVTLTDSFSGRTGKFKAANSASHQMDIELQRSIEMQMDGVLSGFLDPL